MIRSPICEMLHIEHPIFQGGMAWIADGRLAAAVSEAGGLGIISAMNAGAPHLREQIAIARSLTDKPFGVNIMLMSPAADEVAEVVIDEGVRVVTTGAGMPGKYMAAWKAANIAVIPVVASVAMAKMAEKTGADAVIAEGQESGGHIGELTTMALVPQVADAVKIPVLAASQTGAAWPLRLRSAPAACRWARASSSPKNAAYIRFIKIWCFRRVMFLRLRPGGDSAAIPAGASKMRSAAIF